MKEIQQTHIEKIYNFLVLNQNNDKRSFIYSCLEDYPILGKVPSFFCRVPIFHNNFFDKGCSFKNTHIEGYMNLSEVYEIAVTDFILSKMKASKSNLSCEIKYETIVKIMEDHDMSEDIVAESLKNLSQSILTIETSRGVVSFPIFSSIRWNIQYDGVCSFTLSDEVAVMYLLDNLVEYKDLKKITLMGSELSKDKSMSSVTVSDIISTFRFVTYLIKSDKPISISFIMDDFKPSILKPISKRALITMIKQKEKNPIKKALKSLKINFNIENPGFYTEENFLPAQKNALYVEDILLSKPVDQYINFLELELDSKMINKAKDLNIPADKIEIEFNIFKQKYREYKNKYKKSSALSTWANYIRIQFKSGYFKHYEENVENCGSPSTIVYNTEMKNQSLLHDVSEKWIEVNFKEFKNYFIAKNTPRKNWVIAWNSWIERSKNNPIREEKENMGSAKNITMTNEMKDAAISIGYPENRIKDEFFRFKEHYIGEGKSKMNWVSAWKVWVSNSLERSKGKYSKEDLSSQEVMYFIVRKKVSDALSTALISKNVSLSDVIRGVVNIKGITWERVVPPKGQGKNAVNIFMYQNKESQKSAEEAVSRGLGINKEKSGSRPKEEEIIESEVV